MSSQIAPPTRGSGIDVLGGTLIAIMCIVVIVRYYIRIFLKRSFGFDDALIGLALASAIGFDLTVIIAVRDYGLRLHVWDIPYFKVSSALKSAMACKTLFSIAALFTRSSLLCFYTRLVNHTGKRAFVISTYITQFVNILVGAVMIGLSVGLCMPIWQYWNWRAKFARTWNQHCFDEGIASVLCGVLNGVMDLAVTFLPLPLVRKLKMPRKQRLGIMVLFGLGFLVSIVGIVRTVFQYRTVTQFDETWESYPLWIVVMVEIFVMILCACAPALQPMFRKISLPMDSIRNLSKSVLKSSRDTDTASLQPHTHTYMTKDETRCRCAELRELENRLTNPQFYAKKPTSGEKDDDDDYTAGW